MKQCLISLVLVVAAFVCVGYASQDVPEKSHDSLDAINAAVTAGNYSQAMKLATALASKTPIPAGLDNTLSIAGQTAVGEMRLEPAIEFYRLLVEKFPTSEYTSDARAELVGCYNYLRMLDECIAQSQRNLELEPESKWVEYWTFLIAQSHFKQWKFEQAKTELDAFVAKYPDGEYLSHARKCRGKIDPPWKISETGLVSYAGKFDGDIRLEAATDSLRADMEAAFVMLQDRLGIDLRAHSNVIYLFKDSGTKTKPGLKASTYVVSRNNRPLVVVLFYTEFVVSQPTGYRQTITHEMKHAGFKGIMGLDYEELPEWIKEGLAVWGSDDVDTRLQTVLSNKIAAGQDPMVVLDGIDDGEHDEADYMEDALAFEWLESKKLGNVKTFCKQLTAGKPYRESWAELSGLSYEDAMAEANAYCRRRVTAAIGDAYQDFVPLRLSSEAAINAGEDAAKQWLADGGKTSLDQWISENPDHPAEPFARFCLARVLARAGQGNDARQLLQQILDEDGLRCTLLDDAQFWIGVSYNWERDFENAKAAFGVLLRDFSSSHSAKQVRGQFPAAGPVTQAR